MSYAVFNPFSAAIQAKALEIKASAGISAREAMERAIDEAKIAYEMKAMKAEIKATVFAMKVEAGRDVSAPADVVAIVKAEYESRQYKRAAIREDFKARGVKLNVETLASMLPRYSSRAAMIVARNWAKAQWVPAACYAMESTIAAIREGAAK